MKLSYFKIVMLSLCLVSCVSKEPPTEPSDIFLKGSFNDWGTNAPFKRKDDVFYTELKLQAGKYQFKIGGSDWSSLNLGVSESVTLVPGMTQVLTDKGQNLYLDVKGQAQSFVFVLTTQGVGEYAIELVKGKVKEVGE